jgi:hypothetical protein
VITADSFPTPALALRSADPAELRRVRAFAHEQAVFAEQLRVRLAAQWRERGHHERIVLLRQAHDDVVEWRYALALQAPGRIGAGIPLDPERFRTTLRDGGVNYDRLGYLSRLHAGATWDPASRTFQGGTPTPASEVMMEYGRRALERFKSEWPDGDVLANIVALPGTHRLLVGNSLVRGAAAEKIAADLVARVAASGRDTSQMEVGDHPIYVVSAAPDDGDTMHGVALNLLAGTDDLDRLDLVRAWQNARYLMYQAPRTKKGSDAVTRTFLVAVGAVLFGVAPVLEPDVDLRCLVLGQTAATEMAADMPLYAAAR